MKSCFGLPSRKFFAASGRSARDSAITMGPPSAVPLTLRPKPHRQRLDAPDEVRTEALGRSRLFDIREPPDDFVEDCPDLLTRQGRAEAEMRAPAAEGQ